MNFDRLRTLWPSMSARARAAILVLLGVGGVGGGVVIHDRTRPPPPDHDTRPPPTGGDATGRYFWEHSLYLNAPGDLTVRDSTFGGPAPMRAVKLYSMWGVSGDFSRQTFIDTEWGAWGDVGLAQAVMNMNGPVQSSAVFTDCSWVAAPHPDSSPSSMRWGIRGFGIMGVLYDRCYFDPGMGAGIQVALRANEPHGNIAPMGVHRFERLTFDKIGDPKSERWGAFTISEHNPEGYGVKTVPVDVEIIDCKMIGGHLLWTDANGNLIKSPRGVLIQGRKRVVIRNLDMRYPAPYDDWAIQLWDITDGDPATVDVAIEGGFIESGRIELRNCGSAVVKGLSGGAYIVVGTHANDAKPFPMETVQYQGPVSSGYLSPGVK